jgi:hypothetical protein
MKPTILRILIFTMLVGLWPVPVSDFLIGFGFAPVSFVLFWIGLELVGFASLLHLIYLVEAALYLALFGFLAGRVAVMPPRSRGLLSAALLMGTILLWFAPVHIRIEQGIGEEKPLAALFTEEYNRFRFRRAPQRPEEAMIYHPPPGTLPTVTVAPRIESTQPARPGVVEQPAAGEKRSRIEKRNSRQSP